MSELVARTGRHQQRYNEGCRLVPGCIPFKDTNGIGSSDGTSEKDVEVLMINSTGGPGLLFPKGGWENDETVEEAAKRVALEEAGVRGDLMSKTLQDEFSLEGMCKAAMCALLVTEELQSWPEQSTRKRHWLTIPEAKKRCRYQWMRETLEEGFSKWHADRITSNLKKKNHVVSPDSESELMKKAPV